MKTYFKIFIQFTLVVLLVYPAQSQEINLVHYTIEKGLPSNEIYCITQDSKGYIWIGTNRGVSRYDGRKFLNFTKKDGLTDNDIINIQKDSKGRIWLFTKNGNPCYFENNKIKKNVNGREITHPDFNSKINCLYEDSINNEYYFGSSNSGVLKINKKATQQIKTLCPTGNSSKSLSVYGIYHDKNIYKTISNYGISSLENECINNFFKLLKANEKEIIFHSFKNNKYAFLNKLYQVKDDRFFEIKYTAPKIKATSFSIDKDGYFWLYGEAGAIQYLLKNDSLITLNEFIINKNISSVFKDRENNIWLATKDEGLYCHTVNGSHIIKKGKVKSLTHYKNNILFCKNDNVVYSITGDSSIYNFPGVSKIEELQIFKNTLIVKYKNGGFVYDGERNKRYFNHTIRTIKKTEDDLFFNTKNNIFQIVQYKDSLAEKSVLSGSDINFFTPHGNSFYWSNTNDNLFKSSSGKTDNITSSFPFLKNTTINGLDVIEDILWVKTDNGLFKVNLKTNSFSQLSNYDINDFKIDKNNTIWIASKSGLQIHKQLKTNYLSNLNVESISFNNDTVYLATLKGIFVYNINEVIKRKSTSPLLNISSKNTNQNSEILVTEPDEDVVLTLNSIHYSKSNDVQYRYKLKEEEKWKYSKESEIEIEKLPEGEHELIVQASVDGDEWSKKTPVDIKVEYKIWYNWWFYLIIFIILFSIFYYVFLKLKKRKNKQQLSSSIASSKREHFFVKTDGHMKKIFEDEVQYIKSAKEYVEYVCENEKILTLMNMKTAFETLPTKEGFYRVHRSYFVQADKVTSIKGKSIFINKLEIKVGPSYQSNIEDIKNKLNLS